MAERATERKGAVLQTLVLGLFGLVFMLILAQILFWNNVFSYRALLQVALVGIWLCFLGVAGVLALRSKQKIYKHRRKILVAALVFVFAMQCWVGVATAQQVDHDYGKVYNGAVIYATQGNSEEFQAYNDYYHHFGNNVGEFIFLQLLFRGMLALGFNQFYPVTIILGHLFFTLAILFTYLYLEKAFGAGPALLSLLLYVSYLPVYFQSSVMYTDTFSIWMPPLALYLHQKGKAAKKGHSFLLYYAGVGLVMMLGAEIKATVLITGVAILTEVLLAGNWKRLLAAFFCIALVFTVAGAGFKAYKHYIVLEEDRVYSEGMPPLFWVMMGLQGDGSYNPDDEWEIGVSVSGQKERTAVYIKEIKTRLRAMGPVGYLQLLHRKTCRTFGSGNAEIYYLLVRQPNNPSHFIYQIITMEGKYYFLYNNLSQCVYLSFYVLALAGIFLALKNKKASFLENTAPFTALIGFFLFMMLWESNHRQLINQWPLYIIAAASGGFAALQSGAQWLQARRAKKQGGLPVSCSRPLRQSGRHVYCKSIFHKRKGV